MKDICKSRHRGNTESDAAFDKTKDAIPHQRQKVFDAIQKRPKLGFTCKELAEMWGVGMNAISGRFSELKRDGMIVKVGVRDGCGVYVPK